MPDQFERWARSGVVATAALVVIFLTWLPFQIWVEPINRPSILDQMLYTMFGGWMTTVALALVNRGKSKDKDKTDEDDE